MWASLAAQGRTRDDIVLLLAPDNMGNSRRRKGKLDQKDSKDSPSSLYYVTHNVPIILPRDAVALAFPPFPITFSRVVLPALVATIHVLAG